MSKNGKITSNEYVVLRAYSNGMGEEEICKLTDSSPLQLLTIKKTLCQKLEVSNVYYMVKKAKSMGVLDPKNFTDELIRTKTLAFIEHHQTMLESKKLGTTTSRWHWYQILISFLAFLEDEKE